MSRICGRPHHSIPRTPSGQNQECKKGVSDLTGLATSYKLLGHLTFPGPLHFHHLQNEKNSALGNSETYDSTTPLSPQAKEDLVWWRDNLEAWNGKALVSGSSDLVIETDPSQQSWGHFFHRSVHRGSMVSRGISFPHKLSRTCGRGICCQTFVKGKVQV